MGLCRVEPAPKGPLLTDKPHRYDPSTLETVSIAKNWKSYWVSALQSYIAGDVLEVGAGLGTNTALINNPQVRSIHCMEPDEALAVRMRAAPQMQGVTVEVGTIGSVSPGSFDSILYLDVLEHIEDDKLELAQAFSILRPGGHLIVLAPALQALYSPFDRTIGHYRRYDRKSLQRCSPPASRLEKMAYLDCVGLLASGANKLLLKQSAPSRRQILFWDRYMVPASKVLDPLLGYRLGKSIAAVWLRTQ